MKKILLLPLVLLLTACPKKNNIAKRESVKREIASNCQDAKASGFVKHKDRVFVYGYIYDVDSCQPIVNALVIFGIGGPVNPFDNFAGVTDDNGRWIVEFTGIHNPMLVYAYKSGYGNIYNPSDERGTIITSGSTENGTFGIPSIFMKKVN